MPKTPKALIISTQAERRPGTRGQWNKLEDLQSFIKDILTDDHQEDGEKDLSRLVSGVPTPFARAEMFRYAIEAEVDGAPRSTKSLDRLYRALLDEWKGLVSAMVLDAGNLRVEKIYLEYSDRQPVGRTANVFEPSGALGNMLLDDQPLWCHPDDLRIPIGLGERRPFIQVIRYKDQVVGGTSPRSLFFTAPAYRVQSNRPIVDAAGRFTDPLHLKDKLVLADVLDLWEFVEGIKSKLPEFRNQFLESEDRNVERLTQGMIDPVASFLDRWAEELKARVVKERGQPPEQSPLRPSFDLLETPFRLLVRADNSLYGQYGQIAASAGSLARGGVGAIKTDLEGLLLSDASASVAEIPRTGTGDVGVHLLEAKDERGVSKFYTLPLTENGLAIFQDDLQALLHGGSDDMRSRLTGRVQNGQLVVELSLAIVGVADPKIVRRTYSGIGRVSTSVICWPNFIAKEWNKYYLYSEAPHNAPETRVFPLRADAEDFKLATVEAPDGLRFPRLFEDGQAVHDQASETERARLLVHFDPTRMSASDTKYEIYESAKPFKALELRVNERPAGFVIFKRGTLESVSADEKRLSPTRVGVDFGSNNICVSYLRPQADGEKKPELLDFTNRRRHLLGSEERVGSDHVALPAELFFFSDELTPGNMVKSMLMTHDDNRVVGGESAMVLREAGKGGFPVFEKNLALVSTDDSEIKVKLGAVPSTIKYNMKWSDDDRQNAYKHSLLRTLWLMSCAELLAAHKLRPQALIWAYPSAMTSPRRQKYLTMWEEIVTSVRPLGAGGTAPVSAKLPGSSSSVREAGSLVALTEAEAVCRFAEVQGVSVANNAIFIGLDVGGSTTDILCVAMRRAQGEPDGIGERTLIKESSLRVAAGVLANATRDAARFHEALREFCSAFDVKVWGVNQGDSMLSKSTSAYYYNLILDRLTKPEDLRRFYGVLIDKCPELFVLNAHLTGLLMFYAGQLAAAIKREQRGERSAAYFGEFRDVNVRFYGKGGRMFEWLPAVLGDDGQEYFRACFLAGMRDEVGQTRVKFEGASRPAPVKAEVSFGLSSDVTLHNERDAIVDVVGEEGFTFKGNRVAPSDEVMSEWIRSIGADFATDGAFPIFLEYTTIFKKFCQEHFRGIVKVRDMDHLVQEMNLAAFVKRQPDFVQSVKEAKNSDEPFSYKAPLIILEGMCFLEEVLPNLLTSTQS